MKPFADARSEERSAGMTAPGGEADNHTERRSATSLPHPQIAAALYQLAVELQIGIIFR
jgi:hypothetical protein